MDSAALFAADFFLKRGCSKKRIIFIAMVLSAAETLLLLCCKKNGIYILMTHVCLVPLAIFLTFGKSSFRCFLENVGVSYGMMLLLGGIREWILERAHFSRGGVMEYAAATGVFMLVLHYLSKRREQGSYTYEVTVHRGEKVLRLRAYLDSGNNLTDVYTGKPVHIMKKQQVDALFQGEELPVRFVPYKVLGKTDGLMRVVTIDEMIVRQGEKEQIIRDAAVGIAEKGELEGCPFDMMLHAAAGREK